MASQNSCEQIRLDLFLLLHNELQSDREQALRQHLDGCASCRNEHREMAQTLDLLSAPLPIITSKEETWQNLQARLKQPGWGSALFTLRNHPLATALITAFGGLCLAWLLRINARVVSALRETFQSLGVQADWLFNSPMASFLAPLLFILICALITLILSPLIVQPFPHRNLDQQSAFQKADKIN